VGAQGGFQIQQTQAGAGPRASFQSQGVVKGFPQHLKATTDPDDFASIAQMTMQFRCPTLGAEPGQIRRHGF